MSCLILPRRHYSQPSGRAEIDWSNPLTKNLTVCVSGKSPVNIVTGIPATVVNDAGKTTNELGESNVFAASTYLSIPITWSAVPFTLFTVAKLGTIGTRVALSLANSVSSADDVVVYQGGTGNILFLSRTFGSVAQNLSIDNLWISGETSVLAGVTYSSNLRTVYKNGTKFADITTGLAIATAFNTLLIGANRYSGTTGNQFHGSIALSCLFMRALDAEDVKQLSANPWQIFKAK
jgi:hypothetical protein